MTTRQQITDLLALAVIGVALCGCLSPEQVEVRQAYRRAEVIRVCWQGAQVAVDPRTGRLLVIADDIVSFVPPGITPTQLCEGRRQ